jgi:hypothetical protein
VQAEHAAGPRAVPVAVAAARRVLAGVLPQNPSAGGAPPGTATGTPPPATSAPAPHATLPVVAWDPRWLTAPLLGSGSFGDVRAGTVRPYGPVAIKLPRELGSEQAFRDEAAALAALAAAGGGHANVVQVYAVAIEPVDRPHVAILMRRWGTTLHAVLHIEGGRALSSAWDGDGQLRSADVHGRAIGACVPIRSRDRPVSTTRRAATCRVAFRCADRAAGAIRASDDATSPRRAGSRADPCSRARAHAAMRYKLEQTRRLRLAFVLNTVRAGARGLLC